MTTESPVTVDLDALEASARKGGVIGIPANQVLALIAENRRLARLGELAGPEERGETEPCPTCMQPVPVPQRGDHDYGLPLVAPDSGAEERLRAALPDGWKPLIGRETGGWWATAAEPRSNLGRYRIVSTSENGVLYPTMVEAVDALVSALSGGSVDEEGDKDE